MPAPFSGHGLVRSHVRPANPRSWCQDTHGRAGMCDTPMLHAFALHAYHHLPKCHRQRPTRQEPRGGRLGR